MIKVYNTLTDQKEDFVPVEEGRVRMYVCGLTVQNYSHVGHIRSAVNYDVIRRYLQYKGYDVLFVMNFTDVNEKIIRRAREEELTPEELAGKYTRAYLEDIDRMNILRADAYCTATVNIEQIINFISRLVEKGYAYEAEGNVYFSVEKYEDYGKLSGRKLEEMEAGSRVSVQKEKKHPQDFALWKKVPQDMQQQEEVQVWDSPWGPGWPGWHIECSAMAVKFLGQKIDIHGGGTDLIFPHHENEIAQSEACFSQSPFVKYWLHNGTVDIKGEKMSKSLGNFFTTRELLKKFSADQVRYFLLTKHYHSPLEFSLEEVENSAVSFERIENIYNTLQHLTARVPDKSDLSFATGSFLEMLSKASSSFEAAMDDDFNTAKALGEVHNFIGEINSLVNDPQFELTEETAFILNKAYRLLKKILSVLGFQLATAGREQEDRVEGEFSEKLLDFIFQIREKAREEENWQQADNIRDRLSELGITIRDTAHGPVWTLEERDD